MLYKIFQFLTGAAVEDLTNNASNDLMDIEDDESSPVASTPNDNGNVPINPVMEKPNFIHQMNGVSYFISYNIYYYL